MKKILILIASALIGMTACNLNPDNGFIIYNDTELCTIENGKILTDNGLTYEIVENLTDANLEEYNRAIIVCDILKLAGDGVYEIKLKSIKKIQVKDCIDAGTLPEGEALTKLPVSPQSIWFSGGYLNIGFSFYIKEGSTANHTVDLIAKRPSGQDEVVNLYLRHSSDEEPVTNYSEHTLVGSYISFKADEFFPMNTTTEMEVNWIWFREEGSTDASDIVEFSEPGSIERKN